MAMCFGSDQPGNRQTLQRSQSDDESCFVKGKNYIYAIGYKKVRYRGLKKNENRLYAMFACANLYSLAIAGQTLVAV